MTYREHRSDDEVDLDSTVHSHKKGCPAARLVMDLLDRFGLVFATNIKEFYKLITVNLTTAAETEAALYCPYCDSHYD